MKEITLVPFEKSDIPQLISWIPSAKFLLQWAGPSYSYPLTSSQIELNNDPPPTNHLFYKSVNLLTSEVVGHIQLNRIDLEKSVGNIAKVLVGEEKNRGKGYGKEMIVQLINKAFTEISLSTLTLGVFQFNKSAVSCYEILGFRTYEILPESREFKGEKWPLLKMKLEKSDFPTQYRVLVKE